MGRWFFKYGVQYSLILALGVFAMSASAPAFALTCQKLNPDFIFKTAKARTEYIRTKSAANLTQMHGGGGGTSTVGGLGGGEIGYKIETNYQVYNQGSRACLSLDKVKLVFYSKPSIHIASNFHRGTCEYGAVMAHEKKHVRELSKFMREYAPKMKKYFATKVLPNTRTNYGPISVNDINKANEKILEDLSSKIDEYRDQIMPILQERQQKIDSPSEYARVDSKCDSWDKRLSQ